MRDGSQFACMRFHPGIDGGIALDSAVESQEVGFHSGSRKAELKILRLKVKRGRKDVPRAGRLLPIIALVVADERFASGAVDGQPPASIFCHDPLQRSLDIFPGEILHKDDWFTEKVIDSFILHTPKDVVWCCHRKRM